MPRPPIRKVMAACVDRSDSVQWSTANEVWWRRRGRYSTRKTACAQFGFDSASGLPARISLTVVQPRKATSALGHIDVS